MDLEAARVRSEAMLASFEHLRDGLADFQQRMMAVTASAVSDDGLVTVTVGPAGQLVSLTLDPRIYRHPDSRRLAQTITETAQRASADARAQMTELRSSLMPAEDLFTQAGGGV
jgi:DNA-binding protein YbaB